MKIGEKIARFIDKGKLFYSFEYFPPKTDAGLHNLYPRIERMAKLRPAFVDITWGAGGSTSEKTLAIAQNLQQYFGLDVLMHLTCTNMAVEELDAALDTAHAAGVRNILALRGDPPEGRDEWTRAEGGFRYAYELVEHIRKRFGEDFSIGVAAYPEGHLEAPDLDTCIRHLKHKVDQGADFVVTQLFFDVGEYAAFLDRAAGAGITVPILPGLLPIQSYERFKKFTNFTGVKVPQVIWDRLEPIRQDDEAVRSYGVELCVEMCRELEKLGVPGFHFYTLNLASSVTRILETLDLARVSSAERRLPWRPSTLPDRRAEDVRPIFWSNRPHSYMARTMDWEEFPNGRWGDRSSPSFGELGDYYLLRRGMGLKSKEKKLRRAYGEPETIGDVREIFARFCRGDLDVFPWVDGELQAETGRISEQLVALNRAGYLTINSQPQVSGARSDDPELGWGGPHGVVYQKAYLELFLSPEKMDAFEAAVADFPSLTYQAANDAGEVRSNLDPGAVTAVTWGVFPGREILQPTVVDSSTFLIWKDEAFDSWREDWGWMYPEGSPSRELLARIQGTYWLLNLVENDYLGGDIFRVFRALGALPAAG